VSLGLDIPEWAKPLLPKLGEAARLAYRLYFRYEEMKKLGGGGFNLLYILCWIKSLTCTVGSLKEFLIQSRIKKTQTEAYTKGGLIAQ
ncbi:jg27426, partial [Pararge aegeria aegeria]